MKLLIAALLFAPALHAQNMKTKDVKSMTTKGSATAASSSASEPVDEEVKNLPFRFKVIGDEPAGNATKSDMQFKVSDPSMPKIESTTTEDDRSYKVVLGYPKWDLALSLNPTAVGFKQTVPGSALSPNYSSTAPTAYSLTARMNLTPEYFLEGEYANYKTKIEALAGDSINVDEGTVSIDTIMLRGFTCWIGGLANQKKCLGLEIGPDSTPSLEFSGASSLKMSKISDFMVGPSFMVTYPPSNSYYLVAKVGYLHGLATGQNSRLGVKSHSKVIAQGGFEGAIGENKRWGILADFFQRNAKVEGLRGAATESWVVTSSNVGAKLSFTYTFQ